MPTKSPNSKVEAKNSGEVGKSGVAEERRRERKEGRRGGRKNIERGEENRASIRDNKTREKKVKDGVLFHTAIETRMNI